MTGTAVFCFAMVVVIVLIAAYYGMHRNPVAVIYVVFAIVFGGLGALFQHTADSNAKNDRTAKAQVERRNHVRVVTLSTEADRVRYISGGVVCDSKLLHYKKLWLLTTGATCSKLPS